ncbi:MAG: DUF3501 family protein [Beijerinckiaceae bacterium]|nr:DUF3501 family protein [Beijerinckiaceae bacterium]MCI0737017.1 DUF3501 family protein [Beijerinckiaceae bacterium]
MKHHLDPADILPAGEYGKIRQGCRRKLSERKRVRRIEVGPYVTFYFENYETMWMQVHEMIFIEKGGPEQAADELAAYNPLIPKGQELVATFMIEVDDPDRRKRILGGLGGIEDSAFIEIGGERIMGMPETDLDRTTAGGKASSVQFVHFAFRPAQIAWFRDPRTLVRVGFNHPAYLHTSILPEPVRAELAGDFD